MEKLNRSLAIPNLFQGWILTTENFRKGTSSRNNIKAKLTHSKTT